MQDRVEGETPSFRHFVFIAPCLEKRIGFRKKKSFIRDLRPLPVEQSRAHVTYMPKADVRGLRQLRHPPGTLWVAQQHAQHLRGFGLEERFEFTTISGRPVRDTALDEYIVEDKARVADKVEEG